MGIFEKIQTLFDKASLYPGFLMIVLLISGAGCTSVHQQTGSFVSQAETVASNPLALQLKEPSDANIDGVYTQSKADYHFTLAESYSLQDDPSKAVENYKMALVYDQKSPQIRYRLALEYVKLGLVSEGIGQAKEAQALDPQHKDVALLLGGLYSALHLYDQALALSLIHI